MGALAVLVCSGWRVGTGVLLAHHIASGEPSQPQQKKQHFSDSLLLTYFRHLCWSEMKLLGGLVSIPLGSPCSWEPLRRRNVCSISIPLRHDRPGCVLKGLAWGKKHKVKHVGMVLAEGHVPYSTDVASCYLWFHRRINSILQDHCRGAERALQPEKGASTGADHRGASNLTPKCKRATRHPALLKQISAQLHYKHIGQGPSFFFPLFCSLLLLWRCHSRDNNAFIRTYCKIGVMYHFLTKGIGIYEC